MNKLISCVPSNHADLHDQKVLSDISDAEFHEQFDELKFTWYQRLFQVFCFFIFLGPIRAVVGLTLFVVIMAIVLALRWTQVHVGIPRKYFKTFLLRIAQIGFRCLFFAFGHLHIKLNGEIDKEARVVIANHTCFHDAMIINCCRDVSYVAKIEFKNFIFTWLFDMLDPIYVRRDQRGGQTELIKEHINNMELLPILIFPEGTITNGDILLKFHRSPFLTEHKVQPLLIRYWMPFVPKGWNSFAWTHKSTLSFFWSVLSMPFSFVVVDALPASSIQQYESVDAMCDAVQLQCAYALGVKAVTKSSNEIFMKKKEAKLAKAGESKPKDKTE